MIRIDQLRMLGFCLALLWGAEASAALFGPLVEFPVDGGVWDVAIGDVNEDGTPDAVVVHNGLTFPAAKVSVLLGNPAGGFDPPQAVVLADALASPEDVKLGDVTGSGHLDIVVGNTSWNNVIILPGNGLGAFGTAVTCTVGWSVTGVALGDLNGDGSLDVVTSDGSSNSMSVCLNDGAGGFLPATSYPAGTAPRELVLHDFNADGALDAAVANVFSGDVSVFLGDGSGGFSAESRYVVGNQPYSLVVGTVDGDAIPDLITTNEQSRDISVLIGDGTGSFLLPMTYPVSTDPLAYPSDIAIGDLNGDGNLDVATSNLGGTALSVLIGDGQGGFSPPTKLVTGTSRSRSVLFFDLTGDGRPEILVGGQALGVFTNVSNAPPVANAGVDLSLDCPGQTCSVELDGSNSTDPDSTPGTQDNIISYHWYEDYGLPSETLLASGPFPVVSVDLGLGIHNITLVVTDVAGLWDSDVITVIVNPAVLSLLEVTKAEVEWANAEIEIYGKVVLPLGRDLTNVDPLGAVTIDLSTLPTNPVVNQAVSFAISGDLGNKWEFQNSSGALGIEKFKIDWKGARFKYKGLADIQSEHVGQSATSIEIDRASITGPLSAEFIGVDGTSLITLYLDPVSGATAADPLVLIDVDEDEIEVELPFALNPGMTLNLVKPGGAVVAVPLADYWTDAVGKFKLEAHFGPAGVDVSALDPTLDLTMQLGMEYFSGSFSVGPLDWTKLTTDQWKVKEKY